MDALLLIDTAAPAFPAAPPQPLADLIARARNVGGVVVHIAGSAAAGDAEDAAPDGAAGAEGGSDTAAADAPAADTAAEPDEEEATGPAAPVIDSVFGTGEDELVLVTVNADAFEGIEELAPGLGDLGVNRVIVAGGDARGAVQETAMAALVLGFEVILLADGVFAGDGEQVGWLPEAEAAGAVVKASGDVWLKM
ncbi:isochorismatase family protein [Brevibacterium album]|uniref:isochorismatase family protein n=1 Tax=Brevibacterium album TaxID=417948 RepID=UPI000414D3E5|nr:isochorismatase family protein [Brevibacterium album]